jgi:hypothetical protein
MVYKGSGIVLSVGSVGGGACCLGVVSLLCMWCGGYLIGWVVGGLGQSDGGHGVY